MRLGSCTPLVLLHCYQATRMPLRERGREPMTSTLRRGTMPANTTQRGPVPTVINVRCARRATSGFTCAGRPLAAYWSARDASAMCLADQGFNGAYGAYEEEKAAAERKCYTPIAYGYLRARER